MITLKELSKRTGIRAKRLQELIGEGQITGEKRVVSGRLTWFVPEATADELKPRQRGRPKSDTITLEYAARRLGMSAGQLAKLCRESKVPDAKPVHRPHQRPRNSWTIPAAWVEARENA